MKDYFENIIRKQKVTDLLTQFYYNNLICDSTLLNKYLVNCSVEPRRFNFFRKYLCVVSLIGLIIYYSFCALTYLIKGKVPVYYCEQVSYLPGEIPLFIYTSIILNCLFNLICAYILNFSQPSDYYWLNIFGFLRKYEEIKDTVFDFSEEIHPDMFKLTRKGKILSNMMNILSKYFNTLTLIIAKLLAINNPFQQGYFLFGTVGIFISCYYVYLNKVFFCMIICSYTVTKYCEINIRMINRSIDTLNRLHISKSISIKNVVTKHNFICYQISRFNKFWRKFNLVFMFTSIPISQILLH